MDEKELSKSEYRRLSIQAPEVLYDRLMKAEAENAALSERLKRYEPICLLCGKDKPCMTDEEGIANGGPGKPCTFDPTPQQLFDDNKRLRERLTVSELLPKEETQALLDTYRESSH